MAVAHGVAQRRLQLVRERLDRRGRALVEDRCPHQARVVSEPASEREHRSRARAAISSYTVAGLGSCGSRRNRRWTADSRGRARPHGGARSPRRNRTRRPARRPGHNTAVASPIRSVASSAHRCTGSMRASAKVAAERSPSRCPCRRHAAASAARPDRAPAARRSSVASSQRIRPVDGDVEPSSGGAGSHLRRRVRWCDADRQSRLRRGAEERRANLECWP